MNGQCAFEIMGTLSDRLVLESAEALGLMERGSTDTVSRRRERSGFSRFPGSGWGVAIICAIVSLSVVGGIAWAGQRPITGPLDILTTEEETTTESETESESEEITETETEPHTHVYDTVTVEKEPTCSDAGAERHTCSCGSVIYKVIPMIPCSPQEWEPDISSTCYREGTECTTCSECGIKMTRKTGEIVPHVYEDGYCTVCGLIEGAETRLICRIYDDEDGNRVAKIASRNGVSEECIILPNVVYDVATDQMVPVVYIQDGLFKYDSTLRQIVIPDTVTGIGNNTFDHCENLQNVVLPSNLVTIGRMAFNGCTSFTEVIIPPSVKRIGDYAFAYLNITEIIVPEGVETLGAEAFQYCPHLTKAVLPESITRLLSGTFSGCISLTDVTLSSQLTFVGSFAFYGCKSLETLSLPDTVTDIDIHAFVGCSSLTSFVIPPQVTQMSNMFKGCTSLTHVVIPNGITSLDSFWDCSSLQSLHIPASVTSVPATAFLGCSSLAELTIDPENPIYTVEGNCLIRKEDRALILGCKGAEIPDGVEIIEQNAFCMRYTSAELVMPDTVTLIRSGAFQECSDIRTIRFSASLNELEDSVFYNCTSLETVEFPKSLRTVNHGLFSGCTNLKSVVIPPTLLNIGDSMFARCPSITRVDYGGTLSQWKRVTANVHWGTIEQPYAGFTVYCKDGEIFMSIKQ